MMRKLSRRTFLETTGAAAVAAVSGFQTGVTDVAEESRLDAGSTLLRCRGVLRGLGDFGHAVAHALARELGESVDVVNPEGTSAAAHSTIATASPDGRTLGLVTVDIATMHWRGLTQLNHNDFTPLALMSEDPAAIHVKTDGPWNSARDLLAHIRANPGQVKVSGAGHGGIWHLSTAGWLTAAGLGPSAMPWVPSSGPAPALQDLAAGGVDVVVCSVPEMRATPDAKTTRSVAVMARQRNLRYPEVPTMQEATGLRYAAGAWRGVAGPKGLPRETVTRLANALKKAGDTNEFKDGMKRRGFRPVWSSATEFAAFMEAEDKRLGATVQAAGMAKT